MSPSKPKPMPARMHASNNEVTARETNSQW